MNDKKFFYHPEFTIQWHLTERCNWYCKHCYQSKADFRELTFEELKGVLSQCLELFRTLHIPKGRAHIQIGGGEPFLRKDLFKFLELLKKYSNFVSTGIMTNGNFITESVAKDLKLIKITAVQVSLEGLKETNDKIRGRGCFEKTTKAIKILREYNITTSVSSTLTRLNLNEIEDLAICLKSIGVNIFRMRRYVPIGRGRQLKNFMLCPDELKKYYFEREKMKKELDEAGKFVIGYGCEDAIFLSSTRFNHYKCVVTKGGYLNIFPNGDILTCRRFPVVVGNVLKDNLSEIYCYSPKLWNFRNLDNAHSSCKKCSYFKHCLGGARCITYSYFKNHFAPDPQCFRLFKQLPKVNKYR